MMLQNNRNGKITAYALCIASSISICAMDNEHKILIAKQQQLNAELCGAAQLGDVPAAQKALMAGADINAPSQVHSVPPLTHAAFVGQLLMVQFLVNNGADINQFNNCFGTTAFHEAIDKGHLGIVEYLAYNGADLWLRTQKSQRTPIDVAYSKAEFKIVEFIQKLETKRTYASLIDCIESGDIHQTRTLIAKNKDLVNAPEFGGNTPLIVATKKGDIKMVQLLMNYGANAFISNDMGASPVIIALENGNKDLADVLFG